MADSTPNTVERLFFHMAQITQLRNRAQAVVALLGALHELLDARRASFHSLLAPSGDMLVGLVATVDSDGTRLHCDGLAWPDDMALIEGYPHLQASLRLRGSHYDADPESGCPRLTLPLTESSGEPFGFVTLVVDGPIVADDTLIGGLVAVFDNHRQLLDYAEVDTLTRLLNRKTFDESLLRVLARIGDPGDIESGAPSLPHRRRSRPETLHHWLGVVDIDHFKRINDNFGHLIGDEVLILLANIMRASFRAQDRLFRFGGEEFVVLIKPTEAENAALAFERFRQAVASFDFPQVGRVTVSTGFARIGLGDTPSMIFDNADEALYWAKGHGRDQVCSHEQLVAEGKLQLREAPASEMELF
ncbi:MAG: GGDEF domain-containing protein [Sulfurisoma sp.]|nr:GGDEF domain-containing protein [Sulfurisoma sp.]